MGANEITNIVIFLILWVSSLVGFWIKVNLKLKEIEMKVENNRELINNSNFRIDKQDDMFMQHQLEHRQENRDITDKIDKILASLNDFKINVEKRMHN